MNYGAVQGLPGSEVGLSEVVRVQSATTTPSLLLNQYATLLATAPLSLPAHAAAIEALADLPGLQQCGVVIDLAGRHTDAVCVNGGGYETMALFDAKSGEIDGIVGRLSSASPDDPSLEVGTPVESKTFVHRT